MCTIGDQGGEMFVDLCRTGGGALATHPCRDGGGAPGAGRVVLAMER